MPVPPASVPGRRTTRVPVADRWYYEPVPSDSPAFVPPVTPDPELQAEVAAFVADLPSVLLSSELSLRPRQTWMLDGDTRSDAQADADWRQTTRALFGGFTTPAIALVSSHPASRSRVLQRQTCEPGLLQAALTAHNLTPQDSLNGESPHDLVFDVRDQTPSLDISHRNVTTESMIAFRQTHRPHPRPCILFV
jgi:hypothetical protein